MSRFLISIQTTTEAILTSLKPRETCFWLIKHIKDALVLAKTRTAQLLHFVANILNMSIFKKEKINKLTKKSFNQIIKPFKPVIDKLDTYYSILKNYEEPLKA
jgi:molecular chaperone GrpE (heat shock protein)